MRPEETVMIGDDMHLDFELPRRLGIGAILLDRERKVGQSVDASVYDLDQAMKMIIRWHRETN